MEVEAQTTQRGAQPSKHADPELASLSPMANLIVDRAIDNMTRKLVAGYRNKRNAEPGAKQVNVSAEAKEVLKASSAESVMQVANRGQAWKEMIQKSFTHGISSLTSLQFDGQFVIADGQRPDDFKTKMPNTPGVYVVFDKDNKPVYIGDSENMQKRWQAGHFNEYTQGQKLGGKPHKLAEEMEAGCTVKFIIMDSKETAAALEAHLIKENLEHLKNDKNELAAEQGTRSNQEAKKMKDSSGATATLLAGAAGEAFKNVGYDVFERLTTTAIKAIKDELVDVMRGGVAKIKIRVNRVLTKMLSVLRNVLENPLQIVRGIVEFIVNALSKTIGQIYNLARSLFDLTNNVWKLYQGAQTMSREELVRKISETIIVSGSLVIWDSLDLMLEKWLVAQTGGVLAPFAPYISAAVTAVGFGISTHAMQAVVTRIIDGIISFKSGHVDCLNAERAACAQLIQVANNELVMIGDLGEYLDSEITNITQIENLTRVLTTHQPIQAINFAGCSLNFLDLGKS